jgi:hypothetical protein
VSLGSAFLCAAISLADEFLIGNRQYMWIMNVVHPVAALYWGPAWLWAYFRHARQSSRPAMRRQAIHLAARPA